MSFLRREKLWLALMIALSIFTLVAGRYFRQRQLNTLLYFAAYDSGSGPKVEKMRELLAKGADPNAIFVGNDATPRTARQTPLHVAAGDMLGGEHMTCGDDEYNMRGVQLLVEHGADVNVQDLRGNTPLMAASRWGMPRVVRYLLRHGARTDVRNRDNKTAFALARENVGAFPSTTEVKSPCDLAFSQIMREFQQAGVAH